MEYSLRDIAKMIDHSLLHPILTDGELESGCKLALEWDVASVCVKPYYLKRTASVLSKSSVAPGTVVGFPHGSSATSVKAAEVERALSDGAKELDVVVNVGKVLSEDWAYVRSDLKAMIDRAHAGGAIVKVIFENCYLQERHKIRLCEICAELGADFAKTSTGYGTGGATLEDVELMRRHLPPSVQVKAAGGVRTLDDLLRVRAAGATRVGATRTAEILEECRRRLGG